MMSFKLICCVDMKLLKSVNKKKYLGHHRQLKFTKHVLNLTKNANIKPAGTQRPEDVPLWSYFGQDVPDHNRTKVGRIRFLTCFGSLMSDLHLASRNMEKISLKTYFMDND